METLNYLFSNGLIRHHCQSRFFLSYFRSTFPHKIQSHNLLHICSPLYSRGPVINPVYLPATDHKNYQLSNQQYFAAKCRGKASNLQSSKSNLQCQSFTDTVTQQSKYCSSMIVSSGLELGCLWPEGITPIRCRINISTKKLRKRCKLTLRISSGKF